MEEAWDEWLGPCGRSAFVVITQLCCCLQPASLLSRKTSFATTDVGPSSLISRHTDGWGGAQTLVPPLTTLWLSVKAGTLRLSAWAAFFISCSLYLHGVASHGLNNIACGSASVYILASHLSTVLAQWVTSCPFLGGSGVAWPRHSSDDLLPLLQPNPGPAFLPHLSLWRWSQKLEHQSRLLPLRHLPSPENSIYDLLPNPGRTYRASPCPGSPAAPATHQPFALAVPCASGPLHLP